MPALTADQVTALRARIDALLAEDPTLGEAQITTLLNDQSRVPLRLDGDEPHPAWLVSVATQVPCELVRAKLMELEPGTWAQIVMCREGQSPLGADPWTPSQRALAVAVHEWLRYQPYLALGRADVRAQLGQLRAAFSIQMVTVQAILALARTTVSEAEELGLGRVAVEDVLRAMAEE